MTSNFKIENLLWVVCVWLPTSKVTVVTVKLSNATRFYPVSIIQQMSALGH